MIFQEFNISNSNETVHEVDSLEIIERISIFR